MCFARIIICEINYENKLPTPRLGSLDVSATVFGGTAVHFCSTFSVPEYRVDDMAHQAWTYVEDASDACHCSRSALRHSDAFYLCSVTF